MEENQFMAAVTSQQVLDSLKQCMDPEIPISVVDMGLIYGVNINPDNKVDITMTMTTRGCPLHDTLVSDVKRYVTKVPGVSAVDVQIVWEPAWTPEKMSDEGKKMNHVGVPKNQNYQPKKLYMMIACVKIAYCYNTSRK